ncbi:hypothetical protein O181_098008 [Austropuccinia psidii MF-1]|uniref:Uncharacterized protein n=1 Tax=Austropuccinia psidii MF-1 TaxID=1389203 RepID=A0A9Q3J8F5_9BASI|nr:hypothetical protein [Austropuccinia psidii MF-1]
MTTREGSQYFMQSDGGGLKSINYPTKGKIKGKIPSVTESTQGIAISNHIQRAQIDIYMSKYKQYYTVYQDKNWEMLPKIHKGVMNSWHILKKLLKEALKGQGNSEILQWMESTIIQASNEKDKGFAQKKEVGKQSRSQSSFYHQATSQPSSQRAEE